MKHNDHVLCYYFHKLKILAETKAPLSDYHQWSIVLDAEFGRKYVPCYGFTPICFNY